MDSRIRIEKPIARKTIERKIKERIAEQINQMLATQRNNKDQTEKEKALLKILKEKTSK